MAETKAGRPRWFTLLLALAALTVIGFGYFLTFFLLRSGSSPAEPPPASPPFPAASATPPVSLRATIPPPAATPTPQATFPPEAAVAGAPPWAAPIVTRSGGRLVAAVRDQAYYVRYEPLTDLRLDRFARALPGNSFGFEVLSFDRLTSEQVPLGFHVERAGEIVAAAIALQLERMGFRVGFELDWALEPLRVQLGERFRIDLSQLPLRARFSGSVRFVVSHARLHDEYETRAELDVGVVLTDLPGNRLYQRFVEEKATQRATSLEGHAERGRVAAGMALRSFIRELLGDPKLEDSLVAYATKFRRMSP